MKTILAITVALCALGFAGSAHANSTVADPGGSEFTLTDTTGNSNEYVMHDSQASGRWVIYDKTGGKVRITGQANPCQDVPVTTSDGKSYDGVSCPPRATLKVLMGGNSPDASYDQINPKVDAATASTKPFSGRLDVDGGTGTNVIRGSLQSDHLQGGPDADFLLGRDGDDTLLGGNGNDNLDGGPGADRMAGEEGSDDKCCYWDRTEDVTIRDDGAANDGSAQDRNGDNVDTTNEILATGSGNDMIERIGEGTPGSSQGVWDLQHTIESGAGIDRLKGRIGSPDVFKGGDDYDQVSYDAYKTGVTVSQDNVRNDGITVAGGGSQEGDNVMDDVEAVIGSPKNDVLRGADSFPDSDAGPALISGSGGSDKVTPGKRAETLWADGFTGVPGNGDELSYAGRTASVSVTLNDTADDGQSGEGDDVRNEAATISPEFGFDNITLGQNDDTYAGSYAYNIPRGEVPDSLSSLNRSVVDGGPGADKLYPGTIAETLLGGDGVGTSSSHSATDLVSYIYRTPRDGGLTRVAISIDNQPNDGETSDGTALATLQLLAIMVGPELIGAIITNGGKLVELANWIKVNLATNEVLVKTIEGVWEVLPNWDGVRWLRTYSSKLFEMNASGRGYQRAEQLMKEVDATADVLEAKLTSDGISRNGLVALPAAFASSGSEQDDVHDDVEAVQGSNNTGLFVVPQDVIIGNDLPNQVVGSPGPDYVDTKGGNDVVNGDSDGSVSNDALVGGADIDFLFGGPGADSLLGGRDLDALFGNIPNQASDGARDQIGCGDGGIFIDNEAFDLGPYEGDVVGYQSGEDVLSTICRIGLGTPASNKVVATATSTASQVTYTAKPGFANKVKVVKVGSNFEIKDTKGKVEPGVGCQAKTGTPKVAVCPAKTKLSADLGDGKDVFKSASLDSTIATTVKGGDGKDKLVTGAGNDTLQGGPGADNMNGGAGSDTISYVEKTVPVDVYLAQPSTSHNGETSFTLNTFTTHGAADLEGDVISWAESVIGGSGADILQGNQLDNTIDGGAGADAFSGGPGSDTIKAKDGTKDGSILCGDGFDHYQVDAVDPITANSSCEDLQ